MSTQSDVGRQSKVVMIAIIVTIAILGYIAITYFADSSRKQSQISAVQTQSHGTPTKESEKYSQVLDKYNRTKATDAEDNGQSYVSVLSNRTNNLPDQPASVSQAKPQTQQVVYYQQPTQQQNPQQDQQRQKELSDQMKALMENWAPVPHSNARVSTDSGDYAKSLIHESDTPTQVQQAAAKMKVVEDFALIPAMLQTAIDTDENSVVRAYIPNGQYAGAVLFAMGYKRITNSVDMTFSYMQWQNHSYKVTAKAMDQTTMRTALSGNVNNRYFSRIIIPAIAMGISRTGQLYEQASVQNIITPQGGVIQTYPSKPSRSAIGGTIAGGMGQQAGQVMANDAANMPVKQVLIPKDTPIWIQFIGPVLASDDVAAGATGPTQTPGTDPLRAVGEPASQPPKLNSPVAPSGYGGYNNTPYNMPGYTPRYTPPSYYQQLGSGYYSQ
ncbi:conjugal transfer protein TraO (plasmid) [Xylella fastidiosa]|uniref:Conjugal transfer protein TraO n=1 Tax=Xylella fastidiosa TaxID=2371 RepID=A0ABC8AH70_XYLFS|nr:conjugal transfer protein TraO [Xylella fastidiosa]ALR07880.1 conjugal transfer protein TraO [Xylella fastidiosa]